MVFAKEAQSHNDRVPLGPLKVAGVPLALGTHLGPRHICEKYLQICGHLLRSTWRADFGVPGGLSANA